LANNRQQEDKTMSSTATVTSLGVGSGLDLATLLTQLMTAESIPLTTLQTRQASYETKISAFGTVSSLLSTLQSAASDMETDTLESASDKYSTLTATVGDTTVASATASTGATAGSYSLTVSQLATAQKLTSDAVTSSTTSVTSAAATLSLSLGTLASDGTYTASSTTSIDLSAGATLEDMRDAINDADAGVTASIISGTDGAHLVLTSGNTGTDNVISISGLDGFTYDPSGTSTSSLTQTTAAQDAELTIDGISVTSTSNTVSTALDGVTITLTGTTSSATTLTVSSDSTDKITSALESFVSAYNSAYSQMRTYAAYDSDTETAGALQGNSTLRTVMSQLRGLITTTTSGSSSSAYQLLANIGVTIQDDGSLEIDSDTLNAAITADSSTVANLVANIGSAFDSAIENMTGTSGSITVATDSLNSTVDDLTDQEEALQRRLDTIEARYRSQFTALDTLISSLNGTSSYISSFLDSLSSSSSS
jgi:flagellar hook-associated protein 2